MSLAPICILYCKQCITKNEYRICWFSRFRFPGEKSLCNVCIFHCFFSILLLKVSLQYILYKVRIYIWYKNFVGFRGTPLCSRVWLETVVSLVTVGDPWY
jgi:hypothetical protein